MNDANNFEFDKHEDVLYKKIIQANNEDENDIFCFERGIY